MAKGVRGSDQFQIRLPDGMRDRIKAVADANNRSMNAEIVATLEEKYPSPSIGENISEYIRLHEAYVAGQITREAYHGGVPRFFRFFMNEFEEYEKNTPSEYLHDEEYEAAWSDGRRVARRNNTSANDNPYEAGSTMHKAWKAGFESASASKPRQGD